MKRKILGTLLTTVGVILLFLPGPGLLFIALGLPMLIGKEKYLKIYNKIKSWIKKLIEK